MRWKMTTIAKVLLWGTVIGTVSVDDSGIANFKYSEEILESGIEVSPLVMPLSRQVYAFPALNEETFNGLPGLLADSLPDKFGNAMIDAWLESQGRERGSLNAVEKLCYEGSRGMGALEYKPILGEKYSKSEKIKVDALVELASDILSKRVNMKVYPDHKNLRRLISVGTSAGGARAKALIAWNEETGEIRSGQVKAPEGFGQWIIKFDGVDNNKDKEDEDSSYHTRIEYAYYLMAIDCGIEMMESRLYKENGRYHFMTKRFDRLKNGQKLHMQTLGALAHYDFNTAGANSYEQAAVIIRELGMGAVEVKELMRRMVFNIITKNNDDHVKNISFLMNKEGVWSLAPAYDLTYAYNPNGIWTSKHQMTVNGKREDIQEEDILAAGLTVGISRYEMRKIIDNVKSAVGNFEKYAASANINEEVVKEIESTFERI